MKTHKVSKQHFDNARAFRYCQGFWNPAMTLAVTYCGIEPMAIAYLWKHVTCKRCLANRKKP
jgi:hypothetical protein